MLDFNSIKFQLIGALTKLARTEAKQNLNIIQAILEFDMSACNKQRKIPQFVHMYDSKAHLEHPQQRTDWDKEERENYKLKSIKTQSH